MASLRAVPPLVLVALLAGCGGSGGEAAGIRSVGPAARIDPAASLPVARGRAVVELRGIARLDLGTLQGLPQGELTARDPFRRRTMTFTGVRLSDLLAGGRDRGRELYLHALDDYHVELPLADVREDDALLAWKADGRRIPTAEGGPLRIVYPEDSELGRNRDNWIWSVDWMQVRG